MGNKKILIVDDDPSPLAYFRTQRWAYQRLLRQPDPAQKFIIAGVQHLLKPHLSRMSDNCFR